jgi:Transposase IS66 family
VLVTDDADGFKTVADEVGVQHQVCKAHVLRNTETLIVRYQSLVARDADESLKAIRVSPEQAAADLTRLGDLVKSRQREQTTELEAMHRRYLEAPPPQEGEHQSLAYRLRLLLTSSLEPVASFDALSHVEGTNRGNARWHQQCV